MSYRCKVCDKPIRAGLPMKRFIVYRINKLGHWDIAREIPCCSTCLDQLKSGVPYPGINSPETRPTPVSDRLKEIAHP